jgi:hypothetical protein
MRQRLKKMCYWDEIGLFGGMAWKVGGDRIRGVRTMGIEIQRVAEMVECRLSAGVVGSPFIVDIVLVGDQFPLRYGHCGWSEEVDLTRDRLR